jgi:hypothetical protein
MKLKTDYETIVDKYIKLFSIKQGTDRGSWVGNRIGGILDIADMFLSFDDIRLDIDTEQPKGSIIEWYWDNVESQQQINYYSYTLGLRVKHLK